MIELTLEELYKFNVKKHKPVIIMTGLPYSGKTTLRKELLGIWRDNAISFYMGIRGDTISSDDIILHYGKDNKISYNEAWNKKISEASAECKIALQKMLNNRDLDFVIIDQMHTNPSSRKKSLANKPKWRKSILISFKNPNAKEIENRRSARENQVINPYVYHTLKQKYVKFNPKEENYFDFYVRV